MELGIASVFANAFSLIWRRQWVLYLCLVLTAGAAFLYHVRVGDRYEAYSLLRVGQGIKERSSNSNIAFGEGVDLQSRMESLARMAKIDFVIHEAAMRVGYDRLSPPAERTFMSRLREWIPVSVREWVEAAVGAEEVDPSSASTNEPAHPTDVQAAIDLHHSDILKLRDHVTAKQEGRADLLRNLVSSRGSVDRFALSG